MNTQRRHIPLISCALFLLLGLILPSSLHADESSGSYGTKANSIVLGSHFGVHIFDRGQRFGGAPINDYPTLGLRLGYSILDHLDVEGSFNFVPTKASTFPVNAYLYHVSAVGHLYGANRWTPYASFGFGGFSFKQSNFPLSDHQPSIVYALGIKYFMTPNLAIRPEVRGVTTLENVITNVELTVGLLTSIPLTRNHDYDGDGIDNQNDQCPHKAEDPDSYDDNDGCPDFDNDSDGIPDTKDRCPNEPEDRDGIEDEDGCPEDDIDKDGIRDSEDRCPTKPETKNGIMDDDGCPDETPPLTKYTGVITGIKFAYNSNIIDLTSYAFLDEFSEVFKHYPNYHLVIEGHSDSRGRAAYNLELSRNRAESVRQYLIAKGINPFRMKIVPYGETRPVASNSTETGRAQNRRIEFKFVKVEPKPAAKKKAAPAKQTPKKPASKMKQP